MVTDELAERFSALAHPPDDSDWLEVRRLARPRRASRRRFALVAAAVAATAAVAAPALPFRGTVVSWFDSTPAPPKVQESFASLEEGASRGFAPGVIAGETRKIVLPTGVTLWVAPTQDGGFCVSVEGGGGNCDAQRSLDFWPRLSIAGDITPEGAVRQGPVLIDGSTTIDDADTLEIVFEDGKSVTVPVVWVSEPIDAGFYGYEVPREQWAVGHRPTLVILRDADGRELRRDSSAFSAPSFRPGPSDGLVECLFRRGGKPCLDAALGSRGPSKTDEEPARPPKWGGG